VYPPTIAVRQQLSKDVPAATNTHATTEVFFQTSFSVRSVVYERRVGDYFFPERCVIYSGPYLRSGDELDGSQSCEAKKIRA
jgi:hypothetical protein